MVPRVKWRKGSFFSICTILQIDCMMALFCWDCTEVLNPDDCTNPIECGHDEVCGITEFRINDQSRFNMSCVHRTACNINFDAATAEPNLVGKRYVQTRELMCSDCCSTDTCNIKCNMATGSIQNKGWTEWTQWTPCSVTCRGGMRIRHRSCDNHLPGQDCPGSNIETEHCNNNTCSVVPGHIDGGWGSWNAWSNCSKSCDKGSKLRFRKCDNPAPRNNGSNCQGHAMDIADCLLQHCPVDGGWSTWTLWSSCSKTCGPGIKERNRLCNNPNPAYNGSTCHGNDNEISKCNVTFCPEHVDGGWGSWNAWTTCTKSCDKGSKLRVRKCDNPAPRNNGSNCQGHAMDIADCLLQHCSVDGGWSTWTLWSSCSKTCGPGIIKRNRLCNNPNPAYNGSTCHGHDKESTTCNITSCPEHVDGGWGSWNAWTTCTKSCDKGSKLRFRKCDNPAPRNNGSNCQGHAMDIADCLLQHCPVNGGWSTWTLWSSCSKTCGTGIKERNRLCNNPTPSYNGSTCHGNDNETTTCNLTSCRVDGGWSTWTLWSSCSETCAPSIKMRSRLCNNPTPANNGSACHGHESENLACNLTSCPVDGNWSSWSPWLACNVTCGTGVQMRVRTCSNPAPENFGRPCPHPMSYIEFQACNASPCPVVVADCRDKVQACSDPSYLDTICADSGIAAEFCPISCKLCEKQDEVQQE